MSLATIYKKVMDLESRVSEMEGLVKILSSSPAKINQNIDPDLSLPEGEKWDCEKCSSNLGFMDFQTGEIRVIHERMLFFWRPADGGSLTLICHRCSFINKIEYNLTNDKFNDNITLLMEKDNG